MNLKKRKKQKIRYSINMQNYLKNILKSNLKVKNI